MYVKWVTSPVHYYKIKQTTGTNIPPSHLQKSLFVKIVQILQLLHFVSKCWVKLY